MPAWITSLLRDEMPVPICPSASATITSWPRSAAARPIASPITPAPTTDLHGDSALRRRRGLLSAASPPSPLREG